MKFALAAHGTRGDIEPCAAVGAELLRRGHEVRMAAPPNLLDFVKSAGLVAVPYGQLDGDVLALGHEFVLLTRCLSGQISRAWSCSVSCTYMCGTRPPQR